jgi:hypothetical protein
LAPEPSWQATHFASRIGWIRRVKLKPSFRSVSTTAFVRLSPIQLSRLARALLLQSREELVRAAAGQRGLEHLRRTAQGERLRDSTTPARCGCSWQPTQPLISPG